jgi:hypothetical protein
LKPHDPPQPRSSLFTSSRELHISIATALGGNLTDWEKSHGNKEESYQEAQEGKKARSNQAATTVEWW